MIAVAMMFSLIAIPVFATEPSLEEQRQEAESQVNQLQEELNNIMTEMNTLQTQLIETGELIIQKEWELELAEEDRQQQYEGMRLRIRYIYESGTTSVLERILSSGSIAEMLAQAEHVQAVHNHDREMLARFVNTVETIDNLKTGLEENLQALEETKVEYKEQADTLSDLITARSADIAYLDEMIQEAARVAAEQARIAEEQRLAEEQAAAEAAEAERVEDDSTISVQQPPPPTNNFVPPGGNPSAATIIVAAAHSAIGVPYVWGGSTMAGFDCSGLTMWAHAQAGIFIPRTDLCQLHAGRPVPMGEQQPGDIAWTPGHVGLYIGGGMMIEAQQPGTNVLIAPVRVHFFVRFW